MFWRSTWPAFLWAIVILILCGLPGNRLPELSFFEWLRPDKIAHLVLFGIQSYLFIKGFQKQSSAQFVRKHSIAVSIVITILFGALVEVMQTYLFIQRNGDVRDAIANALGAFTGWWFYKKNFKFKTLSR